MSWQKYAIFFTAVVLQSCAYGSTFILVELFASQGHTALAVGRSSATTAIGAVALTFVAGRLVNWLGEIYVITGTSFCLSAALTVFVFVDGVFGQLLGGLLLGAGWGLFYTLIPVVLAKTVAAEHRARLFSLMAVFISMGFGLTPFLANYVSSTFFGISGVFIIIAVGCAIAGSLFLVLHHALGNDAPTEMNTPATSFASIASTIVSSAFPLLALIALGAFIFSAVNSFQIVYAKAHGWNYGHYFLANTCAAVFGRLIYSVWFSRFRGLKTVCILYLVTLASLALYLINQDDQALYLMTGILYGIGYGVSYPIVMALIANHDTEARVTDILQTTGLIFLLFLFGAPYITAPLIEARGIDVIYPILTVLGGMKMIIVIICVWLSARRKPHPEILVRRKLI